AMDDEYRRDESRMVKLAVAVALSDLGDKRAIPALTSAISTEKDQDTKTQLKEALRKLNASPD
ncbi:MAG TPA: HEAT repeat domain-containing protein, partial [Blastocatellia bacterium]|nr:HEAT repeat domain-containing protein [Blastocatellia bacterium]